MGAFTMRLKAMVLAGTTIVGECLVEVHQHVANIS